MNGPAAPSPYTSTPAQKEVGKVFTVDPLKEEQKPVEGSTVERQHPNPVGPKKPIRDPTAYGRDPFSGTLLPLGQGVPITENWFTKLVKSAPTDEELRPDPPIRTKTDVQVPVGSDGRIKGTTLDLTSQLLAKNQGVFIGEKHKEPMARDFLRDNMASLKSQGVKAIFLECVEKKNQAFINAFYEARTPADEQKALARLESVLQSTWGYPPKDYLALIQSAKQHGVHAFGIDERNGPFAGRVPEDNGRNTMWRNQFWARTTNEVMSKEFSNRDKFVLLGGNAHAAGKLSYIPPDVGKPETVPIYGADHALQIPSIRFENSQETKLSPGGYPTKNTPFSLADVDYYVIGGGRTESGQNPHRFTKPIRRVTGS